MSIVITSGGTTEPVDAARRIQNISTGRLGAAIADTLSGALDGTARRVLYVCAENAARPSKNGNITTLTFSTVSDLQERLHSVCSQHHVSAIIHAAAVSDYRVKKAALWDSARKASGTDEIPDLRRQHCGGKLPSSLDGLVLFMERTPKIIAELRELAPEATIVGFKLLDSVPHEELVSAARTVLRANRCDFVLANDLSQIHGNQHTGYLIDRQGAELKCSTKQEIAMRIAEAVLKRRQAE